MTVIELIAIAGYFISMWKLGKWIARWFEEENEDT